MKLRDDQVLLDVGHEDLYLNAGQTVPVKRLHEPYFLVHHEGHDLRKQLVDLQRRIDAAEDGDPLQHVTRIGGPEVYKSYANPGTQVAVAPVYVDHPGNTNKVSGHLFFKYGFSTMGHDVLYRHRVLADFAGRQEAWPFDTRGQEVTLKVLAYDLEATQYLALGDDAPIDVVGYHSFDVTYRATVDLGNEDFTFELVRLEEGYTDIDVQLTVARSLQEEAEHLAQLCKQILVHDVISAHNGLGYDNHKLVSRLHVIQSAVQGGRVELLPDDRQAIKGVLDRARADNAFMFGKAQDQTVLPPCTMDTLLVARTLFKFRDDYTLKGLARDLGIKIPGRSYVAHEDLDLDDPRTLEYARHDVMEQVGLTKAIIGQAIYQCVLTGLPMVEAFDPSVTNVWDHMGLIRAVDEKKTFPVKVRPDQLLKDLRASGYSGSRLDMTRRLRRNGSDQDVSAHILRFLKQGTEAPEWVEYMDLLVDEKGQKAIDFIGGLTIKPQESEDDGGANSSFVPWYDVIVADFGAMYPSLLRAQNANGDTVTIARKTEEPDAWAWFPKIGEGDHESWHVRPVDPERDPHTKLRGGRGWMVGIKVHDEPGLTTRAMGGILAMSRGLKDAMNEEWEKPDPDMAKLSNHKALYNSIKPMRNSGTHGILSSFTTSCRQFAPMPGGWIPSKGQEILWDCIKEFRAREFRIIYGDTDGAYIATSRGAASNPDFAKKMGVPVDPSLSFTSKDDVIACIDELTQRWRSKLNTEDFDLEPEHHGALFAQMHKNYCMLDIKNDDWTLSVKGVNFKGRDKPQFVLDVLHSAVKHAFMANLEWPDEESARSSFVEACEQGITEAVAALEGNDVDLEALVSKQTVKPAYQYKKKANGSPSEHAIRSDAIGEVLGEKIRDEVKLKFIKSRKPLPGIENPKATAKKPLDYAWPRQLVADEDVDVEWYAARAEDYARGILSVPKPKGANGQELDKTQQLLFAFS